MTINTETGRIQLQPQIDLYKSSCEVDTVVSLLNILNTRHFDRSKTQVFKFGFLLFKLMMSNMAFEDEVK